jgi:tRNA pseudouridine55 synthase
LNGILAVDKPRGMTSRQVVTKLSQRLGAEKVGHAGTLDPLATGVLVVCVGRGTLLSKYLAAQDKEYVVDAILGMETDTYDIEGERRGGNATEGIGMSLIEMELARFKGDITQEPPPYSAVKYKGRPLYYYARRGLEVAPRPRRVKVESIDVLSFERGDETARTVFEISCGSGTYIRSIVQDLGRSLGCGACVYSLRRTRSGDFTEGSAVPLERLLSLDLRGLTSSMISLEHATKSMPGLFLSKEGEREVALGKPLVRDWISVPREYPERDETFRVLDGEGYLIALYGPPRPDDGQEIIGRAVRVLRPGSQVSGKDEAA